MTDEIPEKRDKHPYLMYDMLRETPESLDVTGSVMENLDYSFLQSTLIFTGNGTAYHAAQIGAGFLKKTGLDYKFIQSYELLNYELPSHGVLIGLSNSGKTKSTVDSMMHLKKYAYIVGITHYKNTPMDKISDKSIIINSEDKSLCNTKSFFDNAIASMYIAKNYSHLDIDINKIIGIIKDLIKTMDDKMHQIARELSYVNEIFVLGAGPELPVAREVAQKIKEAAHIHAEGIELEEFNHGCTSIIDDKSLLIILNNKTVDLRHRDIVNACKIIGTKTLTVNGNGDFNVSLPELDEYLEPVINTVPLYYLAYYLAVEKNVNPDLLRFDEKPYMDFDNIIFPPGAH